MVREIPAGTGPVVEFGGGTGKITQAILESGTRPNDLTTFELNPKFAALLRHRYPDIHVIKGEAQSLLSHGGAPKAIVSGLPLLAFSAEQQNAVLRAAFAALRPGGVFVQFTYGKRVPVRRSIMGEIGLTAHHSGTEWWNLPPARVYVFSQKSRRSAA